MKKYFLLAVMAALLVMAVFTGCDNGSSSPESKYMVTFDLNWYGSDPAGMGDVKAPKSVRFSDADQMITLPQVLDSDGNIYLTENGYYVGTWYKDADLTQSAGSALTGEAQFAPGGNCILYAGWSTKTVTLAWDLNYPAGVSAPENPAKSRVTAGAVVTSAKVPTADALPDGTVFAGWFDSPVNGEGNQLVAGETKAPFNGLTYYAQWKYPVKVKYLLPDGTEYMTVDQKAYDAVEMPADPVLDPCFAGWFDQDGKMLTADVIIKKDAVYTAKAGYTLVINKTTGQTDGEAGVEVGSAALTIITEPDDHANGKYVEGYYADEPCTTKVAYNDGKLLPNVTGYTDADGKWAGDSSKVLYAKWKKLSNIGSTLVFYIDKTNGRAAKNYKFYDASNNLLTAEEAADNDYGITFSGTPAKYAYYGEGRDRYYVVNDTLDEEKTAYTWAYYTDASTYKQEELCVGTSYQAIGSGRANTAEIMAKDGGKYISDNSITRVLGGANKSATIWYALDDLNKLADAETVSTVSGGKNLGCTDWFVPSLNELLKMTRLVDKLTWNGGDKTKTEEAPYASDPAWADLKDYVAAGSEWSSSGYSAAAAYVWRFTTGLSIYYDKTNTAGRLDAVRAF
ncbi:MAG: hypothetical protein MJ215_01005 [Spirochaetia bacterium]|nr:hypothetical protein [Spirochaetia bacterium]